MPTEALIIFGVVLIAVLAIAARATWQERPSQMRWQLSMAVALVCWGALYGFTWLLDRTGYASYWLFVAPPALGFATGFARPALPALPLTSAVIVVTAYLSLMLGVSIWAARCWDCGVGPASVEWSREASFLVAGFWLGFILVLTLLAIGMGLLLTRYLPSSLKAPAR